MYRANRYLWNTDRKRLLMLLVIENLQLASRLWLEQLYNRLSRVQLQAGAYHFDVGGERMVLKVRWGGRSFFAQC